MSVSYLANPKTTKEILVRAGLFAKHALGQNFLVADATVQHILELADLQTEDSVLEIGPGIGTLTVALLPHVRKVVAIEKDATLVPVFKKNALRVADHEKLTLLPADAMDIDLSALARQMVAEKTPLTKFVSNLPYNIAATVVLNALQSFDTLLAAVVMVQKEVAQRMQATPGTKLYGAYTAKLQLWGEVVDGFSVSRNNFFPAPHVDSAVVKIIPRPASALAYALSADERMCVARFIDAAFSQRRKKMINALTARGLEKGRLEQCFADCGIETDVRAEVLDVDDFIRLYNCYESSVE